MDEERKVIFARKMNIGITLSVLVLASFGVFFIFSACFSGDENIAFMEKKYVRQLFWIAIGLFCYFLAAGTDYSLFRKLAWPLYGGSIVLLLTVLTAGESISGATRWLDVFGITVQPSEFAKLAVLLVLCRLFGAKDADTKSFSLLMKAGCAALVPFFLIIKQPDLGTAMILAPIVLVILFIAGARMKYIWITIGCGFMLAVLLVLVIAHPQKLGIKPELQKKLISSTGLSDYQQKRILVFVGTDQDPLGAGWNKMQSKIAVGSGGVSGKGFLKGSQNILGFLPKSVAPTDFIYSVIAEETGFVGSATVIFFYGLLVACILYAGMKARDSEGRLMCAGIAALIFFHAFINIAMTIGLFPITGLPLPLLSYGGSFMVVIMSSLGIVQSVWIHSHRDSGFEYIWKADISAQ